MRPTDTTVCRVVGMATRYGLDAAGIESQWGAIFCTRPDRPSGPPNPLYNGYRVSFPGANWPVRGVAHQPSSSGEVKGVELYLYSPSESPWPLHGWTLPPPATSIDKIFYEIKCLEDFISRYFCFSDLKWIRLLRNCLIRTAPTVPVGLICSVFR
jgi:hypothetical protein